MGPLNAQQKKKPVTEQDKKKPPSWQVLERDLLNFVLFKGHLFFELSCLSIVWSHRVGQLAGKGPLL